VYRKKLYTGKGRGVFEAHIPLYHLTLGLRVIKKKTKKGRGSLAPAGERVRDSPPREATSGGTFITTPFELMGTLFCFLDTLVYFLDTLTCFLDTLTGFLDTLVNAMGTLLLVESRPEEPSSEHSLSGYPHK